MSTTIVSRKKVYSGECAFDDYSDNPGTVYVTDTSPTSSKSGSFVLKVKVNPGWRLSKIEFACNQRNNEGSVEKDESTWPVQTKTFNITDTNPKIGPGTYDQVYTEVYYAASSSYPAHKAKYVVYFEALPYATYFVQVLDYPPGGGDSYLDGDTETWAKEYYIPVLTSRTISLTADPNSGWKFSRFARYENNVSPDYGSDTVYTSTKNPATVTINVSINAGGKSYTRVYYAEYSKLTTKTLTVAASPAGGGTVNGVDSYTRTFTEGETISETMTASPNTEAGYVFLGWKLNSKTSYASHSLEITRNVSSDTTWTAVFSNSESDKTAINFRIFPEPDGHGSHGTVTVEHNASGLVTTLTRSSSVEFPVLDSSGVASTVTVTPSSGFSLVKWVDGSYDRGSSESPISCVRGRDSTVTVFFGCGNLLFEKSSGGLLEHDGKLVYCG